MEAKRHTKSAYLVSFPKHLTPQQVEHLKSALRSAVVSVSREMSADEVNVQPKINDWALRERE